MSAADLLACWILAGLLVSRALGGPRRAHG